jgi:hypothetical protein
VGDQVDDRRPHGVVALEDVEGGPALGVLGDEVEVAAGVPRAPRQEDGDGGDRQAHADAHDDPRVAGDQRGGRPATGELGGDRLAAVAPDAHQRGDEEEGAREHRQQPEGGDDAELGEGGEVGRRHGDEGQGGGRGAGHDPGAGVDQRPPHRAEVVAGTGGALLLAVAVDEVYADVDAEPHQDRDEARRDQVEAAVQQRDEAEGHEDAGPEGDQRDDGQPQRAERDEEQQHDPDHRDQGRQRDAAADDAQLVGRQRREAREVGADAGGVDLGEHGVPGGAHAVHEGGDHRALVAVEVGEDGDEQVVGPGTEVAVVIEGDVRRQPVRVGQPEQPRAGVVTAQRSVEGAHEGGEARELRGVSGVGGDAVEVVEQAPRQRAHQQRQAAVVAAGVEVAEAVEQARVVDGEDLGDEAQVEAAHDAIREPGDLLDALDERGGDGAAGVGGAAGDDEDRGVRAAEGVEEGEQPRLAGVVGAEEVAARGRDVEAAEQREARAERGDDRHRGDRGPRPARGHRRERCEPFLHARPLPSFVRRGNPLVTRAGDGR